MCLLPALTGVIINIKHFTYGIKDRVGTDRDAEALMKLFIHLGFYTNRYDDLKGKDMRKKLQVSLILQSGSSGLTNNGDS